MEFVGKVISNQYPAGFAVKANIVSTSVRVLGTSAREGEVDRETLIRLSGDTSGVRASGFFTLFGANTGGTFVEDLIMVGKLGNTFDKTVGIVQIVITGMAKTLMPKEAFSFSSNAGNRGSLLDVFVEGQCVKLNRECLHGFSDKSKGLFLMGIDVVNEGTLTCGSKVRISSASSGTGSGGRSVGMGGIEVRWYERSCVAFAMAKNAMEDDVQGFAKFMTAVIGESTSISPFVKNFSFEILWFHTRGSNNITFINDSSAKVRRVERRNVKDARGRRWAFETKEAKTRRDDIRANHGR